ncbi:MAG: substrate-binding domain-containing protein [Paracoccus sp. (in: a-proteobacteria)]|nr:substrate-binding domain-containing protein [Paracoccus sp. (in: a-proteobacteria)]
METDRILIACAGSLSAAAALIALPFAKQTGADVAILRGPAGLLAQAIREGVEADVYVSASRRGPEALHSEGLFDAPRLIAHNRLVLAARPECKGDAMALLDDPRWCIGMSTPGADPGGDYAEAFLDALAADDPERAQAIRSRTQHLFGGTLPDETEPYGATPLGALQSGQADLLLVYATTATRLAADCPGLRILPLPAGYAPPTDICASTRRGCGVTATAFARYLEGEAAQAILKGEGFQLPLSAAGS